MTTQRDGALITMRRQGLSYSEIANATGMSRNTVKSITRHVKVGL
jgi:DNA-binding CsgD family transcriptional regulator